MEQSSRAQQIKDYEDRNHPSLGVVERFLRNANWPMIIYMLLVHFAALCGLVVGVLYAKWGTIALAILLHYVSEMGITAGVHRLWSHRSYKATLPYRKSGCIANQGTIYHWARDHRVHHIKCETDADPHNAERGFFFSHMGWLLVRKDPRVCHAGQDLDLSDLEAMPEVRFQRFFDPVWNLSWCFAFPALVAVHVIGDSYMSGCLVAGALRYVVVLHLTWLVNSAAHAWGFRPYEKTDHHGAWPSENALVSLGAIGEGWHNWHHAYPYDYAASELGAWDQFNPTKKFIDIAATLGLVSDRKRALRAWNSRKVRLAKEIDDKSDDAGADLTVVRRRRVATGASCRFHENKFGLPFLRYRRVITARGDSKTLGMARMPS